MKVNWENYEEYMLLDADGELNAEDQRALYAFVDEHPELRKELDAYKATKMLPDLGIVFKDKGSLIKPERKTIAFNPGMRYALAAGLAAILIIAGLKWFNAPEESTSVVASNNNINGVSQPVKIKTPKDTEELHSKPTAPIAIENKIPKTVVAANTNRKKVEKMPLSNQPAPQQIAYQKEEQKLPAPEQPKLVEPLPVTKAPMPEPVTSIVTAEQVQKETPTVSAPVEVNKKEDKKFLAWLPVSEEKKQGVNELTAAVGDKIEKIKNIKNKLKDSDVSIRIGKKELFVVKL